MCHSCRFTAHVLPGAVREELGGAAPAGQESVRRTELDERGHGAPQVLQPPVPAARRPGSGTFKAGVVKVNTVAMI